MSRYFAPIIEAELADKINKAFVDSDSDCIRPSDRFSCHVMREKLDKDLKVEFDFENFEMSGSGPILGYHTLPNGLTFLGCSAGGDWEHPVYFIIYWDGKKLRGYVPKEGNPWNLTTKQAYGNDEDADLKDARKRWPDCPDDVDGWFDSDQNAMLEDISTRILPVPSGLKVNTKAVLTANAGKFKKSLQQRVEQLTYYQPGDEAGELFQQTCSLAYSMFGLGMEDKAETLYEWAKEMAAESKKWAEEEGYGLDDFIKGNWSH